ncbi:MAG: hypothetical protein F8N39_18110, partial [Clostridiaceae bacterium]|nr:hypothetical protein [Clostridiaceae bacterium]
MSKDSDSREILLQTGIIICVSIIIFAILFSRFFNAPKNIEPWVFAFLTLIGSLLGGIATMLAVHKTIK